MGVLLSKHKEPSLYQSIGNYFSHVLRSNLPTPENALKYVLLYFSELEFQRDTRFQFAYREFLSFLAVIWQDCCPIMWQKNRVGKFSFLASVESNDNVSKGNASDK